MATKKNVTALPDGPPDATGLTPRQQRVLATVKDAIEMRGYPPSMREIGEAVGLTSSSSVAHQLKVLEEKGFLKRDPNRPRALEVFLPEVMAARSHSACRRNASTRPGSATPCPPRPYVPLVGRIAAGGPILAEESLEEVFPLPQPAGRRWHPLPARGLRRLDGRRGDLQRRLRRHPPGADGRERRDRRRACSTARPPSRPSSARTERCGSCRTTTAYDPIDGTHATILGR